MQCPHDNPADKKHGGFTLVEVLVSILILSIALMATLSAIDVSQDTLSRSANMAVARDIAIREAERLRSASSSYIQGLDGDDQYSSSDLPPGNQITRTASLYPDDSSESLWLASVIVTWPEGSSTRSIRYDTLLYKASP